MSSPAPLTETVPSKANVAVPRTPTDPTSNCVQPVGSGISWGWSRIALFSVDRSWLVTARPMRADPTQPNSVVPIVVQEAQQVDAKPAVMLVPFRESFSQTGRVADAPA